MDEVCIHNIVKVEKSITSVAFGLIFTNKDGRKTEISLFPYDNNVYTLMGMIKQECKKN